MPISSSISGSALAQGVASTQDPQADPAHALAVHLERYSLLQDRVTQQGSEVQALNEQIRALGMERAELLAEGLDAPGAQHRLDELDRRLASATDRQRREYSLLEDLSQMLVGALDQITVSKKWLDTSGSSIQNLR
ncbi:hypothetical protein [Bordetella genomosp. 1]|uniref:Uncharacterized protein n=1 Tax=Bordetella genomosp. 1 TaxID=1395607 RepID=A0ABX4F1G5_9BORD|nr:hypothetical protein [Bordetella genomosp. 1]OZI65857.1 hypothetical protein CAL27_12705 [Bordetella genomosp. 1]